jgi:hypothetical protein
MCVFECVCAPVPAAPLSRCTVLRRRSLRPFEHYVPFFNDTSGHNFSMDDIYKVVAQLRQIDADDPLAIQRIIQQAQSFALK